MTKMTDKELNIVVERVLAKAKEERRYDVLNGGTTYGADKIEENLKYYLMGKNHDTPREWKPLLKIVRNELDPEFTEYKRLKEKFEE